MKIKRFSIGNQVATSWEKTKRREITATLPLQKGLIFFYQERISHLGSG